MGRAMDNARIFTTHMQPLPICPQDDEYFDEGDDFEDMGQESVVAAEGEASGEVRTLGKAALTR